jgi:uncharacterized membrane protein YjgN (DUF898 family)
MIAQMAATYLTFLAVVPLWFFASYRARRYKLARTRWRGIRFGMEKRAWGYVLRAIGHWFVTLSTLGLMLPRQTYYLEKYLTDRSWYGDAKFTQDGKWTELYPAMKHLFIGIGIVVLGVVLMAVERVGVGILALIVGYVWGIIGLVYYRVRAFTYLTGTKRLGGDVRFVAAPRTGEVIKIVILGGLGIGIVAAILFGVAGGIFAVSVSAAGPDFSPAVLILPVILYAAALLSIGALSLALITQPLIRHVVETLKVPDAQGLDTIRQRAHDQGADAEGFADALDVGGAI